MARLDSKATICHSLFISLRYIKRNSLVTNFQLVLKSRNHDSDNQYLVVVIVVVVVFFLISFSKKKKKKKVVLFVQDILHTIVK